MAIWGSRVGPLGPTPAHSQMSLRDGIDVRFRGGNSNPGGPMNLNTGGRGQVKGGKPKHIGSMEDRRG